MPHYDYRCPFCQAEFEVFQSITERPVKKCAHCGKTARRLLGTGAGLIFKGSGFYQTDYKSKPSAKTKGS